MAKNIKDIVDEGFSRLASLAEKRAEILQRSQQIATAASGAPFDAAEQKVKNAETAYVTEINTQVEHLLSELRQTMAQVAENNQFFQSGTRDKLSMHVNGLLGELSESRQFVLKSSSTRLDSLFGQTNTDFKSLESQLSAESLKSLAELDLSCQHSLSELFQLHAEISGRLTHSQHDLRALLNETCNSIIQNIETQRGKARDKVEKLEKKHREKLASIIREIEPLVDKAMEASEKQLRTATKKVEAELKETREKTLKSAIIDLQAVSQESIAQMGDSYDYSRKELSERLTGVLELTKQLLQQEQKSLAELDAAARAQADTLCSELRSSGSLESAGRRSAVEEAFVEVSEEINDMTEELNHKTKDLLKTQGEAMAKLCSSAEKGLIDLFMEFMAQMQDNMKVQDQLCLQKEEELLKQLAALAEQIKETRAQLNGTGSSGGAG